MISWHTETHKHTHARTHSRTQNRFKLEECLAGVPAGPPGVSQAAFFGSIYGHKHHSSLRLKFILLDLSDNKGAVIPCCSLRSISNIPQRADSCSAGVIAPAVYWPHGPAQVQNQRTKASSDLVGPWPGGATRPL